MYDTFVALGDSFTEGLEDVRPDGSYRGWADLVAAELARTAPDFRYANLAVRGRTLQRIKDEQLPLAEAMAPKLLTIAAGGNDIIAFRCDAAALARSMREVIERLVRAAGTVVVFTGYDPRGRLPVSRVLAARAGTFNEAVRWSAQQTGARIVDLWTMPRLPEPRMWASDRLHLSTEGHALVADAVLDVLDLPRRGLSPALTESDRGTPWLSARRSEAQWVTTHYAPWVLRKVRGRSTGDLLGPKRPELEMIAADEREVIDLRDHTASSAGRRSAGR